MQIPHKDAELAKKTSASDTAQARERPDKPCPLRTVLSADIRMQPDLITKFEGQFRNEERALDQAVS